MVVVCSILLFCRFVRSFGSMDPTPITMSTPMECLFESHSNVKIGVYVLFGNCAVVCCISSVVQCGLFLESGVWRVCVLFICVVGVIELCFCLNFDAYS